MEALEEKLQEAKRTYKLNVGYIGLSQLPPGFVDLVKKHNPHITELELSSNNLSDLPDAIEEFKYLRVLRLKYNQFKRVPPVVTRLPQLMTLELGGNQITKLDEHISQLTMLKELDLSGNALTELPEGFCSLPKLEVLQLENNRLEQLPENIGDLPSLTKLDLSTNNLRFLPASMGRLKKILRVDVANNILVRVPPSMGHLKNIKELNLRYNNLDERYHSKAEEGLSRLLAFLRDEEERERLEEIERLKPIGTPVGSYLEYRCKAEVGQVIKMEYGELTVDNRCWIRTGHTLTQVGNMLVVFGGVLVKDGTTTNDIFWMTTDRMEWHHQPCRGDKPCCRYGHCTVYDSEHNRLVVFGGRNQQKKRLNDVYSLDLDTWKWNKEITEGAPPSPRDAATAGYYAGHMVVFGGHAAGSRTNDLFMLELSTWSWSQPATTGTAPSPREGAAMCVGHGYNLFIQGGRNNFILEDLYVLDLMSSTWVEIPSAGRAPPPRHGHLMVVHNQSLYLFGGQDDLGAATFNLYRLAVPHGESIGNLKSEWEELDTELAYNKSRTYTLYNGQINMYQLGGCSYGRGNDEDAEKGLVYWDVFISGRLDSLKVLQHQEDSTGADNAKRARVQHSIHTASKMPKSYITHTPKESKMLAYVQDFKKTFEELYPHRRPLYLAPKNACAVPKIVCTTLRPTQLPYKELYDMKGCAQFVADFIVYEPLEDPLHPPEFLPSPVSVLAWQAGDSFDMSVVLASLLLGVGYNAFVVVGYAPLAVTVNDQSHADCLLLEAERQPSTCTNAIAQDSKAAKAEEPGKKLKYQVKRSPAIKPAHPKDMGRTPRGKIIPKVHKEVVPDLIPPAPPVAPPPEPATDPTNGRRVHAWVLVLPGRREVTEPTFIEPSTGRLSLPQQSPYEGIEFIWNQNNFWVCMQMPRPHSDARAKPSQVSFDLSDASKWQALLEEPACKGRDMNGGEEGDMRGTEGGRSKVPMGRSLGSAVRSKTPMGVPRTPMNPGLMRVGSRKLLGTPPSLLRDKEANPGVQVPPAVDSSKDKNSSSTPHGEGPTPPRSEYAPSQYAKSEYAKSEYAKSEYGGETLGGPEEDPSDQEVVPDMPPTWVPKLSIPRDAFDMRCPRGVKVKQYYRCQHEIFALFGECSRWDGMVERLIIYGDDEHSVVVETREIFRRRKDKLKERRSYPQMEVTQEQFHPGSSSSVKEILMMKGRKRVLHFFHTARLDGLVRQEEIIGKKLIETFSGRDDHLVYRSTTFDAMGDGLPQDESSTTLSNDKSDQSDLALDEGKVSTGPRSTKRESEKHLPISKLTERFERNPALDADRDVAKRVFCIADNQICLYYHYGPNRVTTSSRIYHKDGTSHILQVDPLAETPDPSQLSEEYQMLLQAERDCRQAASDSLLEIREILRTRTNQELNITLEVPYYDIGRIKAEQSEEEEEEVPQGMSDYLSLFLPSNNGVFNLTREQALEVREKCLRALKDRLVERANIIQARLDEETSSLAKRQANYQRDREQLTPEEEEEYEQACQDSLFRIQVLEKRIKRHEDTALQKYYDLDRKLRHDPRLQALTQG